METAKKISVYQNISQIAQRKKISINSIEKQASLSRGSICKWNVVNDDQLKLTDIWGESRTSTIESIKNNCLTLRDGDRAAEYYKNGK